MSENVTNFPVPSDVRQRLDELSSSPAGGGGGSSGGMDGRIDRLEGRLDKVDDRLRGVEVQLATLNERVAHLPSKGFIVAALVASMSLVTSMILFQDQVKAFVSP
jgi:predicted nuclease with TOPRIM domain